MTGAELDDLEDRIVANLRKNDWNEAADLILYRRLRRERVR